MNDFEVVLGDATFTVSVRSMFQNCTNTPINSPHFHIDDELHVIISGSVTIEIDGKHLPIKEGDVYIVPKNLSHHYRDFTEDFNKISCLFTLTRNSTHGNGFSEYDYYSKRLESLKEGIFMSDERLINIADELFSLEYSEETEHISKTLYAMLFISVARLVENKRLSRGKDTDSHVTSSKEPAQQKKIIENLIQKRYRENITIEDLSRALYKSVPQTHRIVKKYFGDNFKKILTRQRIEQACVLVKEGDKTLNEIALLSGYNSYGGFLSAFKKHTRKTPEEYRSLCGGGVVE